MIKARSIASGFCVLVAMICTGCIGDAVRDVILDKIESRQSKNDDDSIASSETVAAESVTGSQDVTSHDDATPRAATEFDPYDRSEQSGAGSPPQRDAQSTVPPRDTPNQTGGETSPTNRRTTSSGRTTRPEIRLRTAVALPQSLPTGTAMGFSVDYQFTGGTPDSQVKYVWVIKPPSGQVWESAVQLQSRGTLQAFVLQWGPVSGNYEMRIDEVTRYGRKPATRPVTATY
jgi:hypothetical protein